MFSKRLKFYRSLLALSDALVIAGCWVAAYYIRFGLSIIEVTKGVPPLSLYLLALVLVEFIWLSTFYLEGLYRLRGRGQAALYKAFIRAESIAFLILIAATYFTDRQSFSRIVFVLFLILSCLALPLSRVTLRRFFLASRRPEYTARTIVVGAGELALQTALRLADRPELGVELIGCLAAAPAQVKGKIGPLPVLGTYADLPRIMSRQGVGLVLIALPLEEQPRLSEILDSITDEMVEVKVVPDLARFADLGGAMEELDGLQIISLRESPMHGWDRILKRGLDILVASLALAGLWPVMLLSALAVKLSSKGPIFYVQPRMGLDGRIFRMAKFRTMRVGAEAETGPVWARPGDPRRTRVGRFLRRASLDELPQLIHVLKGEMSLVGPRPERPELIEEFRRSIPRYMLRHKMKAGMTGWAQVNGLRGDTSLLERIDHDLYYIQHWSLWFDLKILAKTLWFVVIDKNAC